MNARALALTYLALWLATLAGAALLLAGARLHTVPAPHDALQPTLATVGELVQHNTLVALWPLALIAVGWPQLPDVRYVGDLLVTGQLLAHGLLVGTALGQHPQLWRYLPHLPLEWLALAIPAGAWFTARTRPGDPIGGAVWALVLIVPVLSVLAAAAAIETYLTPL